MSNVYDIREFGATPDGTTLNTAAIQRAIDAYHEAGGGQVYCGPGAFVTGSLLLRSRVELHLTVGCRLVGSTCLDDYVELTADGFRGENAPEGSSKSLIRAIGAEDVAPARPREPQEDVDLFRVVGDPDVGTERQAVHENDDDQAQHGQALSPEFPPETGTVETDADVHRCFPSLILGSTTV